MRGTNLGVFDGAIELLSFANPDAGVVPDGAEAQEFDKARPRRRARRRVNSLTGDHDLSAADMQKGLDPDRFAGLPDAFIWEEEFVIKPKQHWYQANADRVYQDWLKVDNLSELERRYGVSRPTIRKARDLGKKNAENNQNPPS